MFRTGRAMPTHTVTMRPRASNVTEAQSAVWRVESVCIAVPPSGPVSTVVSVWNAAECRLERSLGAMCGWRGATGAGTGWALAAAPANRGRSAPFGSGIGVAADALAHRHNIATL